jgi:hypothetical protein
MANKSTRQARKERSKAFVATRKAGGTITSPPSKRRSKWRGVPSKRTLAS